jgi:protein SCO1/2
VKAALAFLALLLSLMPADARSRLSPEDLAGLGFVQHAGTALPLDTVLRDEDGSDVRLGRFFGEKPVVLVLDYLGCKTLCGLVLGNLAASLAALPQDAPDYSVVAVSIDPRDTPAAADAAKARLRRAASWHFLTGTESSVRRLAASVGFPYRYDASIDQYAHPAGFVVATPQGTIARYVLGIDYAVPVLASALTAARQGQVSSFAQRLLLLCYGYDPQTGRYTGMIEAAAVLLNLAGAGAMIALMAALYRKRHG